jgi:bacterial/archaeal transporter family protein
MNLSWKAFAVASAVFAAFTAIAGKVGVGKIDSNLATLVRTVIILILTALVVTLRGEWQRPEGLSRTGVSALVFSGLATGLSWLCYYRALQLAPASRVAPVDKLSVVFVVLFAALFLGEPLTWRVALGAVFITVGAVTMMT